VEDEGEKKHELLLNRKRKFGGGGRVKN